MRCTKPATRMRLLEIQRRARVGRQLIRLFSAGCNAAGTRFGGIRPEKRWTDAISHGELIRAGIDEQLEVDAAHLRFVFQGVLDEQRHGKSYGAIPWRLGVLEPAN